MLRTVRSNLLAPKPLPPLNRVHSALIQEERMKSITYTKKDPSEIMGLAVQSGSKMKGVCGLEGQSCDLHKLQ